MRPVIRIGLVAVAASGCGPPVPTRYAANAVLPTLATSAAAPPHETSRSLPAAGPSEDTSAALASPVLNDDRSSHEAQPDYEAGARRLRARIEPELVGQPPRDEEASCRAVVTHLRADRSADEPPLDEAAEHARCLKVLSNRAAQCAALVLSRDGGEPAWVIDQCRRAFPDPAQPDPT